MQSSCNSLDTPNLKAGCLGLQSSTLSRGYLCLLGRNLGIFQGSRQWMLNNPVGGLLTTSF